MLGISHNVFRVHLVIDHWLNHTICVSSLVEFIWVTCGIVPWFIVYLVIDQWLKQTLYVSYFNGYNLGSFGNCAVIEADSMC